MRSPGLLKFIAFALVQMAAVTSFAGNACVVAITPDAVQSDVSIDPYFAEQLTALRARAEAIEKPVRTMKRIRSLLAGTVSYPTFLLAADEFVNAASIRILPPKSMSENPDRIKTSIADFDVQNRETGGTGILVPTLENLDHRRLMRLWGKQKYPMGISEEVEEVDGTSYRPVGFAAHDIAHARIWLARVRVEAIKRKLKPETILKRFGLLNERILDQIDASDLSEPEKERLVFLWYRANHESVMITLKATDLETEYAKKVFFGELIADLKMKERPEYVEFVGTDPTVWKGSGEILKSLIDGKGIPAPPPRLNLPEGELSEEKTLSGFLEGDLRRRALLTIAQRGKFQERLEKFVTDTLKAPPRDKLFQKINDSSYLSVSVADANLLGNDVLPSVILKYQGQTVIVQPVDLEGGTRKFHIATRAENLSGSTLTYSTVTPAELKNRTNYLTDALTSMTPEEAKYLANMMAGVPKSENPKPPSRERVSADAIPLVPFTSFSEEAKARISWPSLNTGGDLRGFELVALALDAIYGEGQAHDSILSVREKFSKAYDGYIQDFVVRSEAAENLQYILRNLERGGNDFRQIDALSAAVLDKSELEARAAALADGDYFDGFKAGSDAFKGLPEGKRWLSMRFGHYFIAVAADKLKIGVVDAYVRNIQRNDDKTTYHFVFDKSGRVIERPREDRSRAYIATQVFLESLLHL